VFLPAGPSLLVILPHGGALRQPKSNIARLVARPASIA